MMSASGSIIGLPAPGNIVKYNLLGGVRITSVFSALRNSVRGNNISFQGAGIGIDLGTAGQDTNDSQDPDTGANDLQNYPLVVSAVATGPTLQVDYVFNSTPNSTFTLDFYHSDGCGPLGRTFGERALGSVSVAGKRHDAFFVTTTYGRTIALDADSGRLLWRFSPSGYQGWAGSYRITNSTPVAVTDPSSSWSSNRRTRNLPSMVPPNGPFQKPWNSLSVARTRL